jgi:hypothetical protein
MFPEKRKLPMNMEGYYGLKARALRAMVNEILRNLQYYRTRKVEAGHPKAVFIYRNSKDDFIL